MPSQSPSPSRKFPVGFEYTPSGSLKRSPRSGSVSSMGSSFSISEMDEENMKLLMDEISASELSEQEKKCLRIVLNVFLSVMTVITMVTQTIITPLYVDAMTDGKARSDAFIAGFLTCMWIPIIFFTLHFCFSWGRSFRKLVRPPDQLLYVFVAGTLAGLSNILVAVTSLSLRTPTYLQGILQQTLIPFTAISRFIIIGKGKAIQNNNYYVCFRSARSYHYA